ncbi:MAG: GNAT family N-acetyltransferase [Akkermansiaceae bacterium]|nr:GNAT family N-acetyltransferase [Armatimonadota bacterium]
MMPTPISIAIRPFVPGDYERVTEIYNLNFPQHAETVEERRDHDEKRNQKFIHSRYVAGNESGIVIAYGEYSQGPWQFHPQKFGVSIGVHPAFQHQGVGTRLYNFLLIELEKYDPIFLKAYGQEGKIPVLGFLAKNGYEEVMREWESCLDPAGFDFAPYAGIADHIAAQGVVIQTLRELESDPCRDRKLYDLEAQISLDMPSSEASTVPTFHDWKKNTFENPGLIPDGYFVALDTTADNKYVGISQLWASLADKTLYTGATGVLSEYRRRGIALAMKLRAVRYAKDAGVPVVRTWNAQSNLAMLSINEKLGFVKEPAWIEYRRVVRDEPFAIRQATPRDYDAVAGVLNGVWHEFPTTASELRHGDEKRNEKMRHDRFLLEVDGKAVAVGEYSQHMSFYDPYKFQVEVVVLPEFQGRGFGKAMYEHLLAALRPFAPKTLTSGTLADRERAVRFLADRGFTVAQRETTSKCDPAKFDPALYTSELEKVNAQGIVIRTFALLQETDPDVYDKFEALHWQMLHDIPHTEEPTRIPIEEFMKRFDSPRFLPDANFFAVEEASGEYVGVSMLWGSGGNNDLHTGMTGVRESHRKRGIATALKIHALTYARKRGADAVWTSNEVGNVGMLGINFRFGFEKQPEELQYTKTLA